MNIDEAHLKAVGQEEPGSHHVFTWHHLRKGWHFHLVLSIPVINTLEDEVGNVSDGQASENGDSNSGLDLGYDPL